MTILKHISKVIVMAIITLTIASCNNNGNQIADLQKKIVELQAKVDAFEAEKKQVEKNPCII